MLWVNESFEILSYGLGGLYDSNDAHYKKWDSVLMARGLYVGCCKFVYGTMPDMVANILH